MTPITSNHDHMKLGDHDHQFQLFNEKSHVLNNSTIHNQGSYYSREAHQQKYYQREVNNLASEGGSSSDQDLKLSLWKNDNGQGYQISGHRHHDIPTKWLPSKLRLVRRMMESNQIATNTPTNQQNKFGDHDHKQGLSSPTETNENSSNSSSTTPVRVCSDCNTTKTPLWRSGPNGPKSLCNACGIRQRKARRALAAAAAAANGTTLEVDGIATKKPKVQEKDKRLKINTKISPSKKRSKLNNNNGSKNQLCFEDFLISLSKNLAFHQAFPQDEKEAAILLMALSCGLVHG